MANAVPEEYFTVVWELEPTTSTPGSSGLSGGAITGIVIGVLVGVCCIVVTVSFVCVSYRRSQEQHVIGSHPKFTKIDRIDQYVTRAYSD